MPKKNTVLARREPRTPTHQAQDLLTGKAIMALMRAKFERDHPGVKYTYARLQDCIETNKNYEDDSSGYLSICYFSQLTCLDIAPTQVKAAAIAQYLQIPVEHIAISAYSNRSNSRKMTARNLGIARAARAKKQEQKEVAVTGINFFANLFVSNNPSVCTADFGVGRYQ